ncbi:GerA spore germination protein [Paenibacillus taihuensis]|uniref:GerA spore germination protein n=1 Tax=Paenibacillus taihuensis TaxID=1156355 RepID=A0A3D9SCT2_9BACL|nr:spore germination protein [Paenibacillus taihuensis]REE91714.1 GerA spore germination protein [Paenibacillus taihuensis]
MFTIPKMWEEFRESSDFVYLRQSNKNEQYLICFLKSITDTNTLNEQILEFISANNGLHFNELFEELPIAEKELSSDWDAIRNKLLVGYVAVQHAASAQTILLNASISKGRTVSKPEIEFNVEGSKEALVESLDVNLNLIRKRLPVASLRIKELQVGDLSKSRVVICYMEDITNEQYVQTCLQRIGDIQFDTISDITIIQQIIEDNSNSIFPQMLGTERTDRIVWGLTLGQVCILVDGSPNAILGPVTLEHFFTSYEDYFLPWIIGSIIRMIRITSVLFSILASAVYVAVLTYHGHGISNSFLPTIIASRINVPFPPVVEVLIMELAIELLREAGARLPSKIGQTIGIVGGIVLGTAAVQAALTSNFLLIIVALSAMASFTTPVFRMSNTIRILRFPFILFAQMWGLLGIFLCSVIVVTHLLRLTSLGMPYLVPFYPLRLKGLTDTVIRPPYSKLHHRPGFYRTKNPVRYDNRKSNLKKDIDE